MADHYKKPDPDKLVPAVLNRRARFCPYCSGHVANYEQQANCYNQNCKKALPHVKPTLPPGYAWCRHCDLAIYGKSWQNCFLCHRRTPFGEKIHEKKMKMEEEMKKMIADAEEEIDEELLKKDSKVLEGKIQNVNETAL